jgi:hypothetical protein
MEIGKVISIQSQPTFTPEDVKKLTDFFSILIRIDQRQKAEQKQSANVAKTPKKEELYV